MKTYTTTVVEYIETTVELERKKSYDGCYYRHFDLTFPDGHVMMLQPVGLYKWCPKGKNWDGGKYHEKPVKVLNDVWPQVLIHSFQHDPNLKPFMDYDPTGIPLKDEEQYGVTLVLKSHHFFTHIKVDSFWSNGYVYKFKYKLSDLIRMGIIRSSDPEILNRQLNWIKMLEYSHETWNPKEIFVKEKPKPKLTAEEKEQKAKKSKKAVSETTIAEVAKLLNESGFNSIEEVLVEIENNVKTGTLPKEHGETPQRHIPQGFRKIKFGEDVDLDACKGFKVFFCESCLKFTARDSTLSACTNCYNNTIISMNLEVQEESEIYNRIYKVEPTYKYDSSIYIGSTKMFTRESLPSLVQALFPSGLPPLHRLEIADQIYEDDKGKKRKQWVIDFEFYGIVQTVEEGGKKKKVTKEFPTPIAIELAI